VKGDYEILLRFGITLTNPYPEVGSSGGYTMWHCTFS